MVKKSKDVSTRPATAVAKRNTDGYLIRNPNEQTQERFNNAVACGLIPKGFKVAGERVQETPWYGEPELRDGIAVQLQTYGVDTSQGLPGTPYFDCLDLRTQQIRRLHLRHTIATRISSLDAGKYFWIQLEEIQKTSNNREVGLYTITEIEPD